MPMHESIPWNRSSTILCSLAGRYGNLIPPRFLAPIDCSKIPLHESGLAHRTWLTILDGRVRLFLPEGIHFASASCRGWRGQLWNHIILHRLLVGLSCRKINFHSSFSLNICEFCFFFLATISCTFQALRDDSMALGTKDSGKVFEFLNTISHIFIHNSHNSSPKNNS